MIRSFPRAFALMVALLPALAASAQDTQTPPQASPAVSLTLEQAVQYAIDHYPTVGAALEQVNASSAAVSVAACFMAAAPIGALQTMAARYDSTTGAASRQSMPSTWRRAHHRRSSACI